MSNHATTYTIALAGFAVLGGTDGAPRTGNAQDTLAGATIASQTFATPTCQVVPGSRSLPDEIRETSGLARGRKHTSVFWTHNDGDQVDLYAIDASGAIVGRVRIEGIDVQDWEDLDAGPCPSGDCLFLSDTGDNSEERESITVFRIEEPDPGDGTASGAVALQARYPEGPADAEALFVSNDGVIHIVTKGRDGPVALYRFPEGASAGEGAGGAAPVTLERIRELFPASPANDERITGADISPDGKWVGIRSRSSLYFYPTETLLDPAADVDATVIDLRPLGEPQGEALHIDTDGTVWLTSEAENRDARPMLTSIRCTFPE